MSAVLKKMSICAGALQISCGEGRGFGVGDRERRQMRGMRRDERRGKTVSPEYREKVENKFNDKQESQKFFDFGLKPFDQVSDNDNDGVSITGVRGATN